MRFTFRIARIVAGRTFDQVVEAQFLKTGRDGFELDVLANPQHKNGSAYLGGTLCLADVTTSRRTGTVRVDVPSKCVPKGAGVLRVSTYTQEKNGSGPGFSEDTMRVKGRVSLSLIDGSMQRATAPERSHPPPGLRRTWGWEPSPTERSLGTS